MTKVEGVFFRTMLFNMIHLKGEYLLGVKEEYLLGVKEELKGS